MENLHNIWYDVRLYVISYCYNTRCVECVSGRQLETGAHNSILMSSDGFLSVTGHRLSLAVGVGGGRLHVAMTCRRGGCLARAHDGVERRPGEDDGDAEPPESRLRVAARHHSDQRLQHRLRVRADVVRDGRRGVDLNGADPANQEAEHAGAEQRRHERHARQHVCLQDELQLAAGER